MASAVAALIVPAAPPLPPKFGTPEAEGYLPTAFDALRCREWAREWRYQNGEGEYAERERDDDADCEEEPE